MFEVKGCRAGICWSFGEPWQNEKYPINTYLTSSMSCLDLVWLSRGKFRVLLERLPDRVWLVGPILWGPWGPWGHPPSLLTVQVDKRCMGTRWWGLEPRGTARHIIYAWRTGGEEGRQTIYDLVSPSSPPGRGRGQHICPKVCKTKTDTVFE